MKKTVLLVLVILTLVLASCVDAHVSYILDEGFGSGSSMTMVIENTKLQARNYADDIIEYWNELGYETDMDKSSDSITLYAEKKLVYENMSTAASKFAESLTAQGTMFSDAEFEYIPSFEQDDFKLSARVNLEDIIRQNEVQDIPGNDLGELLASAEQGSYKLSVSLPGTVTKTNADEQNGSVCSWNLAYGETTDIDLETTLINSAAIDEYDKLQQKQGNTSLLFKLAVVAAGFFLLLIIILFIARQSRKRRH